MAVSPTPESGELKSLGLIHFDLSETICEWKKNYDKTRTGFFFVKWDLRSNFKGKVKKY